MWFRKAVRISSIPLNTHLHVHTILFWIRMSDAFGIATLALQNLCTESAYCFLSLLSLSFSFHLSLVCSVLWAVFFLPRVQSGEMIDLALLFIVLELRLLLSLLFLLLLLIPMFFSSLLSLVVFRLVATMSVCVDTGCCIKKDFKSLFAFWLCMIVLCASSYSWEPLCFTLFLRTSVLHLILEERCVLVLSVPDHRRRWYEAAASGGECGCRHGHFFLKSFHIAWQLVLLAFRG